MSWARSNGPMKVAYWCTWHYVIEAAERSMNSRPLAIVDLKSEPVRKKSFENRVRMKKAEVLLFVY